MLKRTSLIAVVLVVCLSAVCLSAEWQITEQRLSKDAILKARFLKTARIDVPTESAKVEGPLLIPNAKGDGYAMFMLSYKYSSSALDSEAIVVDSVTKEVKRFVIPKGPIVSMALGYGVRTRDGKMYLLFRKGRSGQLWCYDPVTNNFSNQGSMPSGLGRGFSKIVKDERGRIFGNATKEGHLGLYHYDPATKKFHSYGIVDRGRGRGGETHGYSMVCKGDYIYIAVGKVPWRLVAFNTKTEKATTILEAPPGNAQIFINYDYAIRRPDPGNTAKMEMYELTGAKAILKDAEWSWPKAGKYGEQFRKKMQVAKSPPRPKVWKDGLKPTVEGDCALWYKQPGAEEWTEIKLKVNTHTQTIKRLAVLPGGLIFGSRGPYEGNFLYDTKAKESKRLGKIMLSQYATISHNGKIYMSGYPTGPLYEYDPALPWTAGGVGEPGVKPPKATDPSMNPRLLSLFEKSGAHKMWDAASGSDGRVYFCGEVARQGNGGALGWWDFEAEEVGAVPFKTFYGHKTMHCVAAFGGDQIVLGSQTTINNLTRKRPDTAKLFIFDVKEGKITGEMEPIKGSRRIGPMIEVSPGRLLGVADTPDHTDKFHSILFGVDLKTKTVVFQRRLLMHVERIFHSGRYGGQTFILGPDGYVWTYMGTPHYPTLVRIHPETTEITVLGRIKAVGPMAFVGKDLYFGGTRADEKLRRLANIVP